LAARVRRDGAAAADEERIAALRRRGMRIGSGCRIYASDLSTEPYLITIGDRVGIAGGVRLITHDGAAMLLRARRPAVQILGEIWIGSDSFVGENAILLPGTRIGQRCIIGAGAVVRGTVPDNSVVIGNPGRIAGRASLLLARMQRGANALDTFDLPEDERRRRILAHFRREGI
jgi:acetyltransferase-like isoleucine patch superfamily enzyme